MHPTPTKTEQWGFTDYALATQRNFCASADQRTEFASPFPPFEVNSFRGSPPPGFVYILNAQNESGNSKMPAKPKKNCFPSGAPLPTLWPPKPKKNIGPALPSPPSGTPCSRRKMPHVTASVKLLIICFKCHLVKAQQSQIEGDSPTTIYTTIFPLGAVRSPGKFSFQKIQPSILPGSR